MNWNTVALSRNKPERIQDCHWLWVLPLSDLSFCSLTMGQPPASSWVWSPSSAHCMESSPSSQTPSQTCCATSETGTLLSCHPQSLINACWLDSDVLPIKLRKLYNTSVREPTGRWDSGATAQSLSPNKLTALFSFFTILLWSVFAVNVLCWHCDGDKIIKTIRYSPLTILCSPPLQTGPQLFCLIQK